MGRYILLWSRCRHTLLEASNDLYPKDIKKMKNGFSNLFFLYAWSFDGWSKKISAFQAAVLNWVIFGVSENGEKIIENYHILSELGDKAFSPCQKLILFGEELDGKTLVMVSKQLDVRKKSLIQGKRKINECFWFQVDRFVANKIISQLDDSDICRMKRVCSLWKDYCDFKVIPRLVTNRGWSDDHDILVRLKSENNSSLYDYLCLTMYHLRLMRLEPFKEFDISAALWDTDDCCGPYPLDRKFQNCLYFDEFVEKYRLVELIISESKVFEKKVRKILGDPKFGDCHSCGEFTKLLCWWKIRVNCNQCVSIPL